MQEHSGPPQYAPVPSQGGYAPPVAAGSAPNGTSVPYQYPSGALPPTTSAPRPAHYPNHPTPPNTLQQQNPTQHHPAHPGARPPVLPATVPSAVPSTPLHQPPPPRPGPVQPTAATSMPYPAQSNGHTGYPTQLKPTQLQGPRPQGLPQAVPQRPPVPATTGPTGGFGGTFNAAPQRPTSSMPTLQQPLQQQQQQQQQQQFRYSTPGLAPSNTAYPPNTAQLSNPTTNRIPRPIGLPPQQSTTQQPGYPGAPPASVPLASMPSAPSNTAPLMPTVPPGRPAPPTAFNQLRPVAALPLSSGSINRSTTQQSQPQVTSLPPPQQQQPLHQPSQGHYPPPPPPSMMQAPQPASMPPPISSASSGPYKNIDPGQMPRPSNAILPTQVFDTRRENTHVVPLPTDNPIVVRDKGSAGPRYIRCSLNAIPAGGDLLKSSCLPFVAVINPLAIAEHGDTPVSVIDTKGQSHGPMRCSQCKAYACPFMQWTERGRIMRCCFCGQSTTVPDHYYSHLTIDGGRQDILDRPELQYGCVEYSVAGEYQVRPPPPPVFLFLIDATPAAVSSGATASVCASISQLLDELPGAPRVRVGIVTYDSRVQFYGMSSSAASSTSSTAEGITATTIPQQQQTAPGSNEGRGWSMLVMSDVGDPYSPLGGTAAAVALCEHKDALRAVLGSIPKMFPPDGVGESAGGAALKAGIEALKQGTGGRLISFVSSLPRRGALSLRPREAGKPPGERDPLDVMNIEGKEYAALAADAADHQVSVDVFALTQGYCDLATLSTLCNTTSGSIYRYNPFVPAADSARFYNDLRWCLVRPQGLEAVARVRVSSGLAVESYLGAFHRRNPSDIHLPAVSCDHAVVAHIVHEERLPEGKEVYLQYALLYSTMEGQRRVRVLTLALPVTRSYGSIYRGADMEVYLAYLSRKVAMQLPGKSLVSCRDAVLKVVVDTLSAYRKHCATSSSSGQLILPESLKLLPLYALGLTKIPCFRTDARADSRAVWMWRISTMPIERTVPALYPRFVALHDLVDRPSNAPTIPEKLPLSAEKLQPEGVYLLENGYDAYLYMGAAVSPELCSSLLGAPSVDAIDHARFSGPPELDTALSKAVRKVLDEVRKQRKAYMHLRLMRRGHPQEAAFLASLVEDRSPSAGTSYVEYLCYLHRQIQNKLS